MDARWRWFYFRNIALVIGTVGTVSFFWSPIVAAFKWFADALSMSPVLTILSTPVAVTWGLVTILSLLVLWQIARTRNRPVTVLTSKFINRFCDPDGAKVHCRRRQIFRANRPGITSYPIGTWPNFGGSTERTSISIQEDGRHCRDDLVTGSPTAGWQIVHRFKGGLDFSIFYALLPSWVIRKVCIEMQDELPTVIHGQKHLRTLDVEYDLCNEYDGVDMPTVQYSNPNQIRQRDIWYLVEFEDYPVDPESVCGHVITDRTVRDLPHKNSNLEDMKFTFHVPVLVQNSMRISWKKRPPQNAPLDIRRQRPRPRRIIATKERQ